MTGITVLIPTCRFLGTIVDVDHYTINSPIYQSNIRMNVLDCYDLLLGEVSLIRTLSFSSLSLYSSQLLNKFHVLVAMRITTLLSPSPTSSLKMIRVLLVIGDFISTSPKYRQGAKGRSFSTQRAPVPVINKATTQWSCSW